MKSNVLNATGCLALAIAMPCFAGGAYAQEQTPPEQEQISSGEKLLDVVIVTARRKEESLQDSPIAISAFSGDSLEIRGISDIGEIESITPNLTYQNSPGAGGASQVATVYIRGVGQRDFLGTIDNGVGFYIDDVYIPRTVGALVDLVDVDRVEVLRGPQGTLFGRNNVGGAVMLHSKAPSEDFGGYVDAQYGSDNLYSLKAKLDVPISENLLTNVSFLKKGQDGYVDHAGGDLGNQDITAGRFAAKWFASDSFTAEFSGDISVTDDNGPAFELVATDTTGGDGFAAAYNNAPPLAGSTCAYPAGLTSTDPLCYNDVNYVREGENLGTGPAFSEITHYGLRLGLDWALSDNVNIKSITAYRDLDSKFARDADASPNSVLEFNDIFETQSISQELQLSGDSFDSRFDWIVGAYYFNEEGFNENNLNFAIAQFDSSNDFETESVAAFAQGTFDITDKLHMTVGLRWTEEEKSFNPIQVVGSSRPVLVDGVSAGDLILPLGEVSRKDDATTPMFNIAYDILDNFMVYGTYSEGFRSGGFVQRIFPPLDVVPSFGPETAESYEVGFKFDKEGFSLNGAAFQVEYTDIQVRTQNPGFIGFFEANVGDAEIKGFELEAKWSPLDTWFFEGSVGYTDAEYTNIRVEAPLVAVVNLDSEFDHVPDWSVSASIIKDFDLGDAGDLVARLSGDYHDGYFNDPENSTFIVTPERTIGNLTFVWNTSQDNLAINFGVKNFTDERYITAGYNNASIGTADVIRDRGRQFYVGAKLNF